MHDPYTEKLAWDSLMAEGLSVDKAVWEMERRYYELAVADAPRFLRRLFRLCRRKAADYRRQRFHESATRMDALGTWILRALRGVRRLRGAERERLVADLARDGAFKYGEESNAAGYQCTHEINEEMRELANTGRPTRFGLYAMTVDGKTDQKPRAAWLAQGIDPRPRATPRFVARRSRPARHRASRARRVASRPAAPSATVKSGCDSPSPEDDEPDESSRAPVTRTVERAEGGPQ